MRNTKRSQEGVPYPLQRVVQVWNHYFLVVARDDNRYRRGPDGVTPLRDDLYRARRRRLDRCRDRTLASELGAEPLVLRHAGEPVALEKIAD